MMPAVTKACDNDTTKLDFFKIFFPKQHIIDVMLPTINQFLNKILVPHIPWHTITFANAQK